MPALDDDAFSAQIPGERISSGLVGRVMITGNHRDRERRVSQAVYGSHGLPWWPSVPQGRRQSGPHVQQARRERLSRYTDGSQKVDEEFPIAAGTGHRLLEGRPEGNHSGVGGGGLYCRRLDQGQ